MVHEICMDNRVESMSGGTSGLEDCGEEFLD